MQTKRQLKRCTRNVHPSFADFWPGLGVNFHILLTQNWLWESSLSLLSLWCILFQIKLGLFRENLNLKKHLGPKNGWSSPSTFWHRLIYIYMFLSHSQPFHFPHRCIHFFHSPSAFQVPVWANSFQVIIWLVEQFPSQNLINGTVFKSQFGGCEMMVKKR